MSKTFGQEIIEGLQEFADAVENGEDLEKTFTCHQIDLDLAPTSYDSKLVKQTRSILNVTQPVFAKFLGVSVGTVQAWERDENPVGGAASRLMDEIRVNPDYWKGRLKALVTKKNGEPLAG